MSPDKETYKNHLNDLPRFQAPDRVWERLEASMFSIDKSLLPVFQPSEKLWNRIEKSYLYKRRTYKWTAFMLLLLALIIPGYLLFNTQDTIDFEQPSTIHKPTVMLSDSPSASLWRPMEDEAQPTLSAKAPAKTEPPLPADASSEIFERDEVKLSYLSMKKTVLKTGPMVSINYQERDDDCSPFAGSNHEFLWGISYEYQHFLNGDSYLNTEQMYWHSPGLNARLNLGKLFFESGIGLSLSKDNIHWGYDYLQNELINTYEYVDSAHYDPITGVTTHYTTLVEVYDSVPHSKSNTISNKYYYLKIPLLMGAKLYKRRNFSSSLSGGIIYNFLLGKNETEISYYEPDSKVTSVDYRETTRLEHSFNLSLHLNFEWQINQKLNCYVYPSFNYYLNHLYDGKEGTQPLSIGFGAGIFIK
ncbi:MAG: PorT family protein [Bacteroidales bacterium]|nr:PorT family protein [Bacteroidales bacterium]